MQQEIPEITNLVDFLCSQIGICDVKVSYHLPVNQEINFKTFEKKHQCTLPQDFRNFFLTTDGLQITWNVKFGDSKISVGKTDINNMDTIKKMIVHCDYQFDFPSFRDLQHDTNKDCVVPSLTCPCCRIFELETIEGGSFIVMVFQRCNNGAIGSNPTFWLLDRSFEFHFLASNFTQYFRLLLLHLSLPQWQFLYSDIGVSPQAKQYFFMYAPTLLQERDQMQMADNSIFLKRTTMKPFDSNRLFKGRSEKKSPSTGQGNKAKSMLQSSSGSVNMKGKRPLPAVGNKNVNQLKAPMNPPPPPLPRK